jgi:hypothetical protein
VDEVHVNVAHVSGHYYANGAFTGVPDGREAGGELARITAARRRSLHPVAYLERRYQRLAQTYLKGGTVPLVCQAAAASCFLDPVGNVYPCSGFDAPIGSIRDHGYDLGRLWRTARRREVRDLVRTGDCPRCWTPCEAYQTILASLLPGRRNGR